MIIEKFKSIINQKEDIIGDLKVCISYTPNKDNDLLCFMEQYLKAEEKNRPQILKEIEKCINGEKYINPFLAYNYYEDKDIKELDNILDEFIDKVRFISKASNDLDEEVEKIIGDTIFKINELHDKCYGELIDSWRNTRLVELIASSVKYLGYENAINIINEKRLW
ncbi:hypothetical protein K8M07_03955 [Schnuerera sp. xch1]|uniref:hypothetical protein n=1 Tax=Schnuerera sp. xch1 TaxID=2874283 RepID=UPI001CBF9B5E|nr:hypothetical protein [Schnuerera sp. xch1]MBZ2174396.1 hypothetical protein [Schnuerera sp. xch1]